MCGIAGRQLQDPVPPEMLERVARAMTRSIVHRGPDSDGCWVDPHGRCALGFRRLAIQDLSPLANQPMRSESGRYHIVYNGEVYNPEELREWLGRAPSSFRTHGDTEILLACFEKFGIEETLPRVNGMFAVALWDVETGTLSLARDRVGKKPIYYTTDAGSVTFASELKAILSADSSPRRISQEALEAYFALIYIPAPLAIFEGVRKVLPGHILTVRQGAVVSERPYWTLDAVLEKRQKTRQSYPEIVAETEKLLEDAVRRRLISDVPVGLLLSGGVDSSLVALMLRRLGADIESFTVSVTDPDLDESPAAQAIAQKLGIRHTILPLTDADAFQLANTAIGFLDEPFGDSSAIPTYAVCALARKRSTVLLGGDGGDEVFGGYNRHMWGVGHRAALSHLYSRYRARSPWMTKHQVALEVYRRLMSSGDHSGSMSRQAIERLAGDGKRFRDATLLDQLRYLDFKLYLPDDILVKTDRMSMATSMELRSPFLDYRLIEYSWTLPDSALLQGDIRKRITRDLFVNHIGAGFLQHKKHGFALQLVDWLLGPLREEVNQAIDELSRYDGLPWSPAYLHSLRRQLPSRNRTCADRTWLVLMFWRWSRRWEHASGNGEAWRPVSSAVTAASCL
jgi:asparagine synthase (glutamine-hydrolysing)